MTPAERLAELIRLWPDMTEDQQSLIVSAASDFARPIAAWRRSESDVIFNDRVLLRIGDYLKVHHVLSAEPFRKEKLEYALERIYVGEGIEIARPSSRTETHDLVVRGQAW
jgi:hypothetical protein